MIIMMIVRTKTAKRITVSYATSDEADTIESNINLQFRGNVDYENGRIVVGRNTDDNFVYINFYEDCTEQPFQKVNI